MSLRASGDFSVYTQVIDSFVKCTLKVSEHVMLGFGFCDVEESAEGQHIILVKVYEKDRYITVVFMHAMSYRC